MQGKNFRALTSPDNGGRGHGEPGVKVTNLATADEMARRRPDMIRAEVPHRGHIPFLDEGESLTAIRHWLKMVSC